MDCKEPYKELIEQLRDIVTHGDDRPAEYCTNRCGGCDACDRAADAIETLLAEREAAMKYIPHNCQTCKWWEAVKPGMACCKAPDDAGPCYLGSRKAWQWRGPTPPDRQQTESDCSFE